MPIAKSDRCGETSIGDSHIPAHVEISRTVLKAQGLAAQGFVSPLGPYRGKPKTNFQFVIHLRPMP